MTIRTCLNEQKELFVTYGRTDGRTNPNCRETSFLKTITLKESEVKTCFKSNKKQTTQEEEQFREDKKTIENV